MKDMTITARNLGARDMLLSLGYGEAEGNVVTFRNISPKQEIEVYNKIGDCVLQFYDEHIANKVLKAEYTYFSTPEQAEIMQLAKRKLANTDKNMLDALMQIRRRNVAMRAAVKFFEESTEMDLVGFVNFRLGDYEKDVSEIVGKAVDEYLLEREYHEFINLLRYFVDIQESKHTLIHVIPLGEKKYQLRDAEDHEIDINEYIEVDVVDREGLNPDDFLFSSLITLAPAHIMIHKPDDFKNKELLKTIKEVFRDKVEEVTNYARHKDVSVSSSEKEVCRVISLFPEK